VAGSACRRRACNKPANTSPQDGEDSLCWRLPLRRYPLLHGAPCPSHPPHCRLPWRCARRRQPALPAPHEACLGFCHTVVRHRGAGVLQAGAVPQRQPVSSLLSCSARQAANLLQAVLGMLKCRRHASADEATSRRHHAAPMRSSVFACGSRNMCMLRQKEPATCAQQPVPLCVRMAPRDI